MNESTSRHDLASSRRTTTLEGSATRRSRKGCPTCRQRKIKCDERRPECSQCLKTGRECKIIDGLFRIHSSSISKLVRPDRPPRTPPAQTSLLPNQPPPLSATVDHCDNSLQPSQLSLSPDCRGYVMPGTSSVENNVEYDGSPSSSYVPSQIVDLSIHRRLSCSEVLASNLYAHQQRDAPVQVESSVTPSPMSNTTPGHCSSHVPEHSISLSEENARDRSEITFFLRYASEGPTRWMDVTGHVPYFSQYLALLSDKSALVRYAAVALAAKQLGQTKEPYSKTQNTTHQGLMTKALTEAVALEEHGLNFLWYGAKYYEKAIQLLFKQLAREDCAICHPSPRTIYQADKMFTDSHDTHLDADGSASSLFQIIAACILCQYEDLSATEKAVSGHLDGVYKLIWSFLSAEADFAHVPRIPESQRAMEAAFWYFTLNDMLDAHNSGKPCRVDTEDFALWRRMGLPLDETASLILDIIHDHNQDIVLLRSLIRLGCLYFRGNVSDPTQWLQLNDELNRWCEILPPSFSASIQLPLPPGDHNHTISLESCFLQEVWFGTDVCPIAMAFYHMISILLLVNLPQELFTRRYTERHVDLLAAYNAFQRDLYQHAIGIISIAQGKPSYTVRKYLVQPLYVAGRSLTDMAERKNVLGLFRDIENELGVCAKYRISDLLEEWGPSSKVLGYFDTE
ncbi:uncharacterized protein N7506_001781 [Penicillium brevicompactum]|uniref:uncharacterized protein n=1 Tax=Penicillium brevicompactum TaxID=5074 RepID=UPI002542290C|nr:uncharacterized protein N7506_001781 [Penicillium brevicompactum]KAJ5348528.1 hypothetical protein N7506_001781 [Penicillium brevicompactum]